MMGIQLLTCCCLSGALWVRLAQCSSFWELVLLSEGQANKVVSMMEPASVADAVKRSALL